MNLLQALAKTPLTWTLEKSSTPYEANPKHTVQTVLVTVVPEPGAAPLTRHFRVETGLSTEQLVVTLLKEKLPTHPVLREWLNSKGNVPVRLTIDEAAFEYIGEPMHTALRKLADSKASVITWNALHHMHSNDRAALWTAAADVVKSAFLHKRPPTRRSLAKALQERVIEVLDDQAGKTLKDDDGREFKRKDSETFALRMMHTGCEMTDIEEWMWGWLGYVIEDVPAEEPATA